MKGVPIYFSWWGFSSEGKMTVPAGDAEPPAFEDVPDLIGYGWW